MPAAANVDGIRNVACVAGVCNAWPTLPSGATAGRIALRTAVITPLWRAASRDRRLMVHPYGASRQLVVEISPRVLGCLLGISRRR